MRTKRLAKQLVMQDPRVLPFNPETEQPTWADVFGRKAPLHLEVGMGSGRHLAHTAKNQPETNHVGLESKYYRVLKGTWWANELSIDNTRYLLGDCYEMDEAFAAGEVDAITMLFPDPWPRAKGDRFRLTNPTLVERYKRWLKPGGYFHFRSDHELMFTYSLERFRRAGFEIEVSVPIQRVQSDFEMRFLSKGLPIYGFVARRPLDA
ncbi:tRNA (guanosine(46)-N7)-methyltransferase TrmB [bacterium]|nr:tRNA (guanosine(46)-N7)-methyltransferase TrmB [bacterium]